MWTQGWSIKDSTLHFIDSHWVILDIQTCYDAFVYLSFTKSLYSESTYKIIIGGWGNSMSIIQNIDTEQIVEEYLGAVFKCNIVRTFWLSWASGLIRVGFGYVVGESLMMEYDGPLPQPRYVGIGSSQHLTATWIIYKGKSTCVY